MNKPITAEMNVDSELSAIIIYKDDTIMKKYKSLLRKDFRYKNRAYAMIVAKVSIVHILLGLA